jgi:hypothetical protein
MARAFGVKLAPTHCADVRLDGLVAFMAIARAALPQSLKASEPDVLRLAIAFAMPPPSIAFAENLALERLQEFLPVWLIEEVISRRRHSGFRMKVDLDEPLSQK